MLRVKKYGLQFNPNSCDYLSVEGCMLNDLRPHNCISHMCPDLIDNASEKGFYINKVQLFPNLERILSGEGFNKAVDIMDKIVSGIKDNLSKDSIQRIENQYSKLTKMVDKFLSQPCEEIPLEFRVRTYLGYAYEYYKLFKEINLCASCLNCCCKDNFYDHGKPFNEWAEWDKVIYKLGVEKFGEPKENPKMCNYLDEDGCRLEYLKPIICLSNLCSEYVNLLISLDLNVQEDPVKKDMYNILSGHDFKSSVKRMQRRVNDIKVSLPRIRSEKGIIQDFIKRFMREPSINFPLPGNKLLNE
jgi:hypothetical protein